MIIRKIQIDNYLCYYDTNTFELSEGLNIILGENGEGKTKFFESVDWLFNGENRELDMLVSAKKLNETEIGDSFRVRVSMTVEQYGEKSIITKSFLAKKEKANECSTSSFMIEGISENSSGERSQVDGQALLDRIFPFQIRKYSMFKGEAELNIFESDSALANLINLFSEAKHYDKYSEKGAFLREKAEKAVEDSSKLDKKNEALYKKLEGDIIYLEREKAKYLVHLNSTEEEIRKIEGNLQLAESHVSNADALETLNRRIKDIEEKISYLTGRIDENYTTSLFDENWILVNFESFHKEFAEKVSAHSKTRRELQSEFDKQKGIKVGEKKAKAELLNNAIPLPNNIPSKAIMEEMLDAEICKVCNREAKKGSEAYEFMMKRLKTYLESQVTEDNEPDKDEPLFKYDYTNRLDNLSISHEDNLKNLRLIRTIIKELFEFNDDRKKDIEELNEQLEKEKTEREKILGNSSIGAEKLSDVLKNYNAWQRDLKNRNQDQVDYTSKLKSLESELKAKKEEKDKIDTSSANSFLIKTRNILRDIETIFIDTKENKFEEFIEKLQTKSNRFLEIINIDSFTGEISIYKKNRLGKTTVEVQLMQNGRPLYKPNESLETSMYISILFAISELAYETKNEYYPLIFDAPTSSFGDYKTAQFLNLIYETKNQKILVTKNFLDRDKATKKLFIKKDFESVKRDKAFWVKLEEPFNKNDLTTINTQVINL
ncbi:AAA family ATPase [Flavobacterium azooxidireducens]|uniref:AAA family ATPase n=1 Tax=Flavobacterium azooxidireducens TaxID=1871076 RepID=A0ABY4KFU8_9FLAO|nr:AAA family ATPase [Flavobacterium azooxidireducens]UPQ78322.1 AAA family ATPase [Flavobacterium azooxidireducens]